MTSSDYTFLLNHPASVNDRKTEMLEKIVAEFPYFQSARALRLKGLYNQNSFQYNYALKVTAAYTTDRSVLFDFITSDTFTAIHKGLYEKKIAELHNIDVEASEVLPDNREPQTDPVHASILTSIKAAQALSPEDEIEEIDTAATATDEAEPASGGEEIINDFSAETQVHEIQASEDSALIDEIAPANDDNPETDAQPKAADESNADAVREETAKPDGKTAEENLQIGQPLAFSKTETHSFQEWLQLSRIQPIVREEETVIDEKTAGPAPETEDPKAKKIALIDRFIETNPKIPPVKPAESPAPIPEVKDVHSSLMTETLARVYLEQKKYQKAIQAYEILILKYPEKSSFFADRISEIKSLQQNT